MQTYVEFGPSWCSGGRWRRAKADSWWRHWGPLYVCAKGWVWQNQPWPVPKRLWTVAPQHPATHCNTLQHNTLHHMRMDIVICQSLRFVRKFWKLLGQALMENKRKKKHGANLNLIFVQNLMAVYTLWIDFRGDDVTYCMKLMRDCKRKWVTSCMIEPCHYSFKKGLFANSCVANKFKWNFEWKALASTLCHAIFQRKKP